MLGDYFKLFEECYLVEGEEQGSVYNLLSGYIYDISREEQQLLFLLENNNSISEIVKTYNFSEEFIKEFLEKLCNQNIGRYFERPNYIEKITKYPSWTKFMFIKSPPTVGRAFINIEKNCNKKCEICDSKIIRRFSCFGCHRNNIESKQMSNKEIFEILNKLKKLQCKELYFTGGNIFMNFERTQEILKYAKSLQFECIKVIYGGEELESEIIETLISLDISILLQIYLKSGEKLKSKKIINQISSVKEVLNKDILILLDDIKSDIEEEDFKYMLENTYPKNVMQDAIYNKDSEDIYFNKLNTLYLTSIDDFSIKKERNLCLNSTVYINYDGKVTPCPGLSKCILGDINDFYSIFSDENIYKYWNLNKDLIKGCSVCSHRYGCNDCRALEYSLGEDMYGMKSCNKIKSKVKVENL